MTLVKLKVTRQESENFYVYINPEYVASVVASHVQARNAECFVQLAGTPGYYVEGTQEKVVAKLLGGVT